MQMVTFELYYDTFRYKHHLILCESTCRRLFNLTEDCKSFTLEEHPDGDYLVEEAFYNGDFSRAFVTINGEQFSVFPEVAMFAIKFVGKRFNVSILPPSVF